MVGIIKNKYKKVADFVYELCRFGKVPLYFSKYSNKLYSNVQHLFLLVYKQAKKFTYEELLNDLISNKTLMVYVGLNKLPHFTTLIKFASRLSAEVLDKLVLSFKQLLPDPKKLQLMLQVSIWTMQAPIIAKGLVCLLKNVLS